MFIGMHEPGIGIRFSSIAILLCQSWAESRLPAREVGAAAGSTSSKQNALLVFRVSCFVFSAFWRAVFLVSSVYEYANNNAVRTEYALPCTWYTC